MGIVPSFAKEMNNCSLQHMPSRNVKDTALISVAQVILDFRNQDLTLQKKEAKKDLDASIGRQSRFWRELKQCIKKPLCDHLLEDKNLVFAITKCPFDDNNHLHFQALLSIFKQLTGQKIDCPRYGPHWEQIGFQGDNPATDLRGVGFLGLIQPLYLVTTPELLGLAKAIYKLSLSDTQEFPLMVLSINVTRIALHALRDDLLVRYCNQEDDLWQAFNFFYVAIMYHIYHIWKTKNKTIQDSGYVLQDAEKFCRKNVNTALKTLDQHLVTAYTLQEKQAARDQIRKRFDGNS